MLIGTLLKDSVVFSAVTTTSPKEDASVSVSARAAWVQATAPKIAASASDDSKRDPAFRGWLTRRNRGIPFPIVSFIADDLPKDGM